MSRVAAAEVRVRVRPGARRDELLRDGRRLDRRWSDGTSARRSRDQGIVSPCREAAPDRSIESRDSPRGSLAREADPRGWYGSRGSHRRARNAARLARRRSAGLPDLDQGEGDLIVADQRLQIRERIESGPHLDDRPDPLRRRIPNGERPSHMATEFVVRRSEADGVCGCTGGAASLYAKGLGSDK